MAEGFTSRRTRIRNFTGWSYIDLATKQPQYLTTNIPWDVEWFDLTHDGKMIAFLTNEEA